MVSAVGVSCCLKSRFCGPALRLTSLFIQHNNRSHSHLGALNAKYIMKSTWRFQKQTFYSHLPCPSLPHLLFFLSSFSVKLTHRHAPLTHTIDILIRQILVNTRIIEAFDVCSFNVSLALFQLSQKPTPLNPPQSLQLKHPHLDHLRPIA